jgi:non-ribosomal peptide synthetase component F
MRSIPPGETGELPVGGIGLARGYLGLDELTAAGFAPNPFFRNGHPERLYKTGDLTRFAPDGAVELLGRILLQAAKDANHPVMHRKTSCTGSRQATPS